MFRTYKQKCGASHLQLNLKVIPELSSRQCSPQKFLPTFQKSGYNINLNQNITRHHVYTEVLVLTYSKGRYTWESYLNCSSFCCIIQVQCITRTQGCCSISSLIQLRLIYFHTYGSDCYTPSSRVPRPHLHLNKL